MGSILVVFIAFPLAILQIISAIPLVPFALMYEHIIEPLMVFFSNISL